MLIMTPGPTHVSTIAPLSRPHWLGVFPLVSASRPVSRHGPATLRAWFWMNPLNRRNAVRRTDPPGRARSPTSRIGRGDMWPQAYVPIIRSRGPATGRQKGRS